MGAVDTPPVDAAPAVTPGATILGTVDPAIEALAARAAALARADDREGLVDALGEVPEVADWIRDVPDGVTVTLLAAVGLRGGTHATFALARKGRPVTWHIGLFAPPGEPTRPAGAADVVPATIAALRGALTIDPRAPTLAAQVELTLAAPEAAPFVVALGVSWADARVEQDGQPCRSVVVAGLLFVEPRAPGTRFSLAFTGTLDDALVTSGPDGARTTAVPEPVRLPVLVGTDVALQVRTPRGARLFTAVPASGRDGFTGRVFDVRGHVDQLPLWVTEGGGPVERRVLRFGSTTIELAGAARLDAAERAFTRAFAALAPLGPYPDRRLSVALLPGVRSSEYLGGAMVWASVGDDDVAAEITAHELSHAWFGGVVMTSDRASTRWWEAVASYLGSWVFDEEVALITRREWLRALAALDPALERPDLESGQLGSDVSDTLSYRRGALVLAGLEVRVGRPAMARWLRALVAARRGQVTRLDDMLATIGPVLGEANEAWVRAWLRARGPATIALVDATVVDGRLRATLVCDAPVRDLRVAIALRHDTHRRGEVTIAVTEPRTPIDLALPDDVNLLVLDSDATLPLRHAQPSAGGFAHVVAVPGRDAHVATAGPYFVGEP